eukprot:UC4_evm10s969
MATTILRGSSTKLGKGWVFRGHWAPNESKFDSPQWEGHQFLLEGPTTPSLYTGHFVMDLDAGSAGIIPEIVRVRVDKVNDLRHLVRGIGGEFLLDASVDDGDFRGTKEYVNLSNNDEPWPTRLAKLLSVNPAGDSITRRLEAAVVLKHAVPAMRSLVYIDQPGDVAFLLDGQKAIDKLICWSYRYDEELFCSLVWEGLFPFSDHPAQLAFTMLGKLATRRCVLKFSDARASKKARKEANRYIITTNVAFSEVLDHISTKKETWLHSPLKSMLQSFSHRTGKVRLISAELWEKGGRKRLVAGELGLCYGAIYTSLTGFHLEGTSKAGEVQILALAALLQKEGFLLMDFDEPQQYMESLGGTTISSVQWLKLVKDYRSRALSTPDVPTGSCAAELLDAVAPRAASKLGDAASHKQEKKHLKRLQKSNGVCITPLDPLLDLQDDDLQATFSQYGQIYRAFYVQQTRRGFIVFKHEVDKKSCLDALAQSGDTTKVGLVQVTVIRKKSTNDIEKGLHAKACGDKRKRQGLSL